MDKVFEEMKSDFTPPEGFVLIPDLPPAYDYGKFFIKIGSSGNSSGHPELGFFIRPEHVRSKGGHAGGGILLCAADYLMGFVMYRKVLKEKGADYHPTTVSMTTDFLGPAVLGDWVTPEVQILKVGSKIISVQCLLHANGKPILRASASYIMVQKAGI
jgi:acyl-coenzyme A thioesterase PaaI-like protein